MTFDNKKPMELLIVLNDLVKIHDDRIEDYLEILARFISIDTNLKAEFYKIISFGEYFKQQLLQQIKELTVSDGAKPMIWGKIYNAWRDLKVTFSGKTQKEVIAHSLYNELVTLYAYEAALDKNIEMGKDIRQLIEKQESDLRTTKDELKKCGTTYHTIGSGSTLNGFLLN